MTARRSRPHDAGVRPACPLGGDSLAVRGDGRPADSPPDLGPMSPTPGPHAPPATEPAADAVGPVRAAAGDDAQRWARLAVLGQHLVGGLDERAAEQAVVDAARELLGTDVAGYVRISVDPPAFEVRAVATGPGSADRVPPVGADLAVDLAAAGRPIVSSEPFMVTDITTAPAPWAAMMGSFGLTTIATVIVGRLDQPLGLLGVATAERRPYGEEDTAIITALASLLAGAAERAAGERALEARLRQQEALADLGSRVIAGLDVGRLAQAIVDVLAHTAGADVVAVLRLADEGRRFELFAGEGVGEHDMDTLDRGPGTIGAAVIASDDPIVLADLRASVPPPMTPLVARLGVASLAMARIGERAAPFGILGMGARQPDRFGHDDAAFVRGLANLLASAVALEEATGAVADQARRIEEARFEERTALAREIHDGLVQDLWLARLHHGLLTEAIERGEDVAPRLGELGSAIERAGEDARQAVVTLRAGADGQTSLAGDLATYAADIGRRLAITVETRTDDDLPDLPSRTQAELLRIVQEILTNAARHAAASRVIVETVVDRRGLRIAVSDDGRGFDPGRTTADGVGLAGMRERAALIGAAVAIRSAPTLGTTVTVRLPRRAWGGR